MPKDNEVDEKVIWSDDLAAVLEAASEASQVPLMWLANQDFSPEQTKAWLCEAVDATVEEGAFSGSLHQVAEEGTGHVVAFTGCGPKSAANAKFLIGCAHFILKHRDSLSDHAATVAELRAEVERLNAIVNTPQANDFLRAVSTEAEHQRQRWGSDHDAGKTPADWFWLVGYLAGKALHAHGAGDTTKAEHHIITTAAALANWHLSMFGKTDMRPGIDGEAALTGADPT